MRNRQSLPPPVTETTRGLWLALIVLAAMFALVALRYRAPAARAASASTELFSAERALMALGHVLGDGQPHPIGSAANAAVRSRIVDQLWALGYTPEIQRGFSCERGECGAVENIVAVLHGREPEQAVVLSAHYDSVPAGPGASDDGAGVASVLEIARVLRVRPQPRHTIILLVTDGEELGLLGARVFIAEHPLASRVRAAVNIEARGSSGPSVLFETGSANAWAMKLYDGRVPTPITSSLYYTAYQLLPNDTDFSVFKTRDWQGYNFAFTDHVQHYHTPLDTLANVSPDSMQHHGDNALGVLLALADAADLPLPAPAPPDASKNAVRANAGEQSVYVDVFAAGVLRWPFSAALPAAIIVALAWLVLLVMLVRSHRLRLANLAWGLLAAFLALALAAFSSYALLALLRKLGALPPGDADYQWTAYPLATETASAAVAVFAVAFVSALFARRTGFWGLWAAAGLLTQAASVASAALLPGISFTVLLPALALPLFALPAMFAAVDRAPTRTAAAIVPCLVSAFAWMPTLWLVYQTLGLDLLPVIALLIAWMLLHLMPLLVAASRVARRMVLVPALLLITVATAIAAGQPAYTADSPQRLNFEYWVDTDTGKAEWIARQDFGSALNLPESIAKAATFTARTAPLLPWDRSGTWTAEAPMLAGHTAPVFEVIESTRGESGRTHYRVRLASSRGAPMASACFAPEAGVENMVVAGYALPAQAAPARRASDARRQGWRCYADHTLLAEAPGADGQKASALEAVLEFDVTAKAAFDVIVTDRSFGLPEEGRFLIDARPATATASQNGDITRVSRKVTLQPP